MTRRSALRALFALFLLLGTFAAALLSTASVAAAGHTGQALALRAALHPGAVTQSVKSLLTPHQGRSALIQRPGAHGRGARRPFVPGQTSGPPILDPYSPGLTGEVVHVTNAAGTIVRNGDIAPGAPMSFTVRLTPQADPIDPNNVYIQIKDPDSKYQDAQGLEHKVFTQDAVDSANANNLTPNPSHGDSGSASLYLFNGGHGELLQAMTASGMSLGIFAPATFTVNNNPKDYPLRGSVGGYNGLSITVGRTGGGTNPVMTGTPAMPLPGDDPTQFTSFGQEYECQYVNAQFAGPDTTPADYGTPYYLAGVDDQNPNSAPPAQPEWLQLHPAVVDANGNAVADSDGSFRYTATWTSPTSPSDYYLDVIAYDTASNWRIYDNVWGFSTLPWDTTGSATPTYPVFSDSSDILVVSDNALGQKFAASSFASSAGATNLLPAFYGTESYFTDYDIDQLPNAAYTLVQPTANAAPDPEVIPLFPAPPPGQLPQYSQGIGNVLNGLGVGSYSGDGIVDLQQTTVAGIGIPKSQAYSLWRTLSRGPLDPTVLNAFSGALASQPAINDAQGNLTAPATTDIPVATKCVIWDSPYASETPLNQAGSFADQRTQSLLRAFVRGGAFGGTAFSGVGRLFVSGPQVASVVSTRNADPTQNAAGSFISDVLNALWTGTDFGGKPLADGSAAPNRITHDAFVNFLAPGVFGSVAMNFFTNLTAQGFKYQQPVVNPLFLGNDFYDQLGGQPSWRTDGSLSNLGPYVSNFGGNGGSILGLFDTITPQNGAHTGATSDGNVGLIFNENFNTVGTGATATPGAGFGSRVVFSSFGLDELGIEYVKVSLGSPAVVHYVNLNQRPNVLHNIVCYLRTGTFTGLVFANNSTSQPVQGATVYLKAQQGVTLPGPNQNLSATTDATGRYVIPGVEPGAYQVVAYKPGFINGVSNPGLQGSAVPFTVEGDTTTNDVNLNLTPEPAGRITGTVSDANGAPIPGAHITFTSTDGLYTTATATSAADGSYVVDGIIPDTYTGVASASGFMASQPSALVTVPSGAAAGPVNFTLAAVPGTLGGLVTDDFTHLPVAGAIVTVKNATSGTTVATLTTTATATTIAAGAVGAGQSVNYSVATLPQGTYTVSIAPPVNFSNPQPAPPVTITITTNQFQRQDFTLTSTLGTLQGTVTDATSAAPIDGATVTVKNAAGAVVKTFTTAANGTYSGQVPQGAYTLTASAPGFVTAPTSPSSITITAHGTFTANAQLLSALGTLGGEVTNAATGQALTGATVTITDPTGAQVAGSPFTTTTPVAGPNGSPINFGPVTLPAVDAGGNPITYQITVADVGAGTAAQPDFTTSGPLLITLTPRAFKADNVALSSAFGNIGGLVADSLTPTAALGGATISIADSTGAVVATLTSSGTATAAPDGSGPINYATTTPLYQGVYTVTALAANHTAVSQPVTVVGGRFARADFTPTAGFPLVSTQGTLGGQVLDASTNAPVGGVTVTVTNAAGAVVATFTSSATATVSPSGGVTGDGGAVNYGGLLTAGTYTVSIQKSGFSVGGTQSVTIKPNTFSRKDFSGATYGLTPVHVFQAGYNFFSVPYDYATAGVGFDTLFGTLNSGTTAAPSAGSNRSHVFVWNPTLLQYVLDPTAPADGLHLGQGYWVYLLSSHEVTVTGPRPTTTTIPFTLHQGWNQIGVPSLGAISVSNLTFTNPATGAALSFSDASGSTFALISGTLYGYNGSTYTALTAGGSMQPWQSYWIYAFHDVTVNIPTS